MQNTDNQYADILPDISYSTLDLQTRTNGIKDLVILYINLRSAVHRWEHVETLLPTLNCAPNIIVISETWLRDYETQFYNIDGYTAHHCTRHYNGSRGRGGGTAILTKDIPRLQASTIESISLYDANIQIIKLVNMGIHIIAVYRPEQTPLSHFFELFDEVLHKYKKTICIGDFNINILQGNNSTSEYRRILATNGSVLLNSLDPIYATRDQNTLDHICTDLMSVRFEMSITDFSASDHKKIVLRAHFKDQNTAPCESHIDIIDHTTLSASSRWETIAEQSTLNSLCVELQNLITENRKTVRKKHQRQTWMTAEILALLKTREKFFRYSKRFPHNMYVKELLISSRIETKTAIKRAKKLYIDAKFNAAVGNPKQLWNEIKTAIYNKHVSTSTEIQMVNSNGAVINDKIEICNVFNDYFAADCGRNAPPPLSDIQSYLNALTYTIRNPVRLNMATEQSVSKQIDCLQKNKATGYDGIAPRFLIRYKSKLVTPITRGLNKCIETGIYPDLLKISKIVPIHKSNNKAECRNYRPISVLSALNSICEEHICLWFDKMLAENCIIHDHQYGFRKDSNTLGAVLHMTHFITKSVSNKRTSVLFLDLKKAFDSINQEMLLSKITKLNLDPNELSIFRTYITGRTQFVKLGSIGSQFKACSPNGVPQGSRIGPKAFIFYINDIFKLELCGEIILFADDAAIMYSATSAEQLGRDMQHDINALEKWFRLNDLSVNAGKSKWMLFSRSSRGESHANADELTITINGSAIERVDKMNYLGLVIDEHLKWDKHVDKIKKEITPYVFILYKSKFLLSETTKKLIYNAHILSRLSYLAPAWRTAPQYKLAELKVMQHSALKSIGCLPRLTPSLTLFSVNTLSLENLLKYETMLIMHKIIKGKINHSFDTRLVSTIHNYGTRNRNNYYVDVRGGRLEASNILIDGLCAYNQLPQHLKDESNTNKFKSELKKKIFDNSV